MQTIASSAALYFTLSPPSNAPITSETKVGDAQSLWRVSHTQQPLKHGHMQCVENPTVIPWACMVWPPPAAAKQL